MYLYSFYTWALGPSSGVGTLRPECIATYIYMEPYKSSRVGNLEPSWGLSPQHTPKGEPVVPRDTGQEG